MISDYTTAEAAVWLTTGLGALNWGLKEVFQTNLVTELLGSSSGLVGPAYLVIGLAGALSLADDFDVLDLSELV